MEGNNEVHVIPRFYHIRGRLVCTLVGKLHRPGSYNVFWEGRDDCGRRVSSGVYLYRMQAGDILKTQKMVLLKLMVFKFQESRFQYGIFVLPALGCLRKSNFLIKR